MTQWCFRGNGRFAQRSQLLLVSGIAMPRLNPAAVFSQHIRIHLAEILASFVFSFLMGFASHANPSRSITFPLIAGFALVSAQAMSFDISRAHLNPAISFTYLLTRKISSGVTVAYTFCQLFGAFAGSCLHKALVPPEEFADTVFYDSGVENQDRVASFLLETILTAILCIVHVRSEQNPVQIAVTWSIISYASLPTLGLANNISLQLAEGLVQLFFLPSADNKLQFIYLDLLAAVLGAGIAAGMALLLRDSRDQDIDKEI